MKRLFSVVLAVLAVSGYAQETESLSAAPRAIASYFEARLSKGATALLLTISAPAEAAALAEYVTGELSAIFVNDRHFTMVDRSGIVKGGIVKGEVAHQLSGAVSDETAQSVGHQTGAEFVVWGSLEQLGASYRLNVRAISVKTAEIQAQRTVFLRNDQFLTGMLGQGQAAARPLWIDEPSRYGMGASGGSQWYYEVGVSNRAASEQLARTRARENVQAAVAANIASDIKARIDVTEFALFMSSDIEDAQRRVEAAITMSIKTRVPRYEALEWHIESGKDDNGKAWWQAYLLARLPRREIVSVVENLDCARAADTAAGAGLRGAPDAKAAVNALQAEMEAARDYALEELRGQ
ncbi:MAG: CsgG/HfaB family protein [Treponema sp.]|jgi:hypothetical protein|nr:CsgG/HfaB family protein [Treponema sp.]